MARLIALLALGTLLLPPVSLAGSWDRSERALDRPVTVTIHKSPSCGCCTEWAEHLRRHGFTVEERPNDAMDSLKQTLGVPQRLASCHTAEVEGYLIEGHVPADDIKRLLAERPPLAGLAVPGMPAGSPGMEMGPRKERFAVIGFDREGEVELYRYYGEY